MRKGVELPPSLNNPILFTVLLFKRNNFVWRKQYRKRDFDCRKLRREYEILLNRFSGNVNNISTQFNVQIILDRSGIIEKFGSGAQIFLKLKNGKYFLFTEKLHFFSWPFGVIFQNKFFTRLDEILIFKNIKQSGTVYDPCPLLNRDMSDIENRFKICFEVWTKSVNSEFNTIYIGSNTNVLKIKLHYQQESDTVALITDEKLYFKCFFQCKNAGFGCRLQFKKKRDLDAHLKICKTIEEAQSNPKIVQKMFGSDCEPHELALSRQFLIDTPKNPNFIFYDIECVLTKENTLVGQSLKTFSHKLVSIAVNSFINNEMDE